MDARPIRNADLIQKEQIAELGELIAGETQGRTWEYPIGVAGLTGLAVQDYRIAEALFLASEFVESEIS